MGLGHAAAGGILLLGAALAGFDLSDHAFDGQERLVDAWDDAHALDAHVAQTRFSVTDVQAQGQARTTVTVHNDGGTTLDASAVTMLFDGVPVAVESWTVDGVSSDVWAPGTDLALRGPGPGPDHVVVIDRHGVQAVWRA